MGCTSSAPNTVSANTKKEDKSIQFEENAEENYSKNVDANDTKSDNRTEIKVLPPSDIEEPVQIVRNNKSTASLEPEKDLHTNGQIVESEHNDTSETKDEEKHENISKLEEVIGMFIEINQQDMSYDKYISESSDEPCDSKEKSNDDSGTKIENVHKNSGVIDDEHKSDTEDVEQTSPSQSQSSRATRWEALADIAAELPPSLTVDPITGQIYTLSK